MAPPVIQSFVNFADLLRQNGFAISPDQTMGFVAAVGLLGPASMRDIRLSAISMLAIPKDREPEFDELFRSHFYGQTLTPTVAGEDGDELEVHEPGTETREMDVDQEENETGELASAAEVLSQRGFSPTESRDLLRTFSSKARRQLPKRKSYRFSGANRGQKLNMSKLLRSSSKTDGDVIELPWLKRKQRQRKILLLIDVSGSMSELSENYIRFAHALCQVSDQFECFTFGTRLTRITTSLKPKERGQALERVSQTVADFDGGTRIGDALNAFLEVPRYRGYARGALVLVISDGLERGAPDAMIAAVSQIRRIAWRLHWLSPLASSQDYTAATEAMTAILPYLDDLAGAENLEEVCSHVLSLARAA